MYVQRIFKDPQKLLFRDIFLDTAQFAGIVLDLDFIDETKVYVTGGSQKGEVLMLTGLLDDTCTQMQRGLVYMH